MPAYTADPSDPDAPVPLMEFRPASGEYVIKVGDRVIYAGKIGLPGEYTVDELWAFPAIDEDEDYVEAICDGGKLECDASNLRRADG